MVKKEAKASVTKKEPDTSSKKPTKAKTPSEKPDKWLAELKEIGRVLTRVIEHGEEDPRRQASRHRRCGTRFESGSARGVQRRGRRFPGRESLTGH